MSQTDCKTRAGVNDAPEQPRGQADMNSLQEFTLEATSTLRSQLWTCPLCREGTGLMCSKEDGPGSFPAEITVLSIGI